MNTTITGIVVVCQCADGKHRLVRFDKEGKLARSVHHFIHHKQGGAVHLYEDPVQIVNVAEDRQAGGPTAETGETPIIPKPPNVIVRSMRQLFNRSPDSRRDPIGS